MSDQQRRMERLYRLQAPIYDWTRWAILAGRQGALAHLDPQPGERVLDLGCGTGSSLPQLAEAVGPSGEVLGLECASPMLRRAQARCRGFQRVSLLHGDILDLAGELAHFDKILLSYSLTLMPAWQPVLEACLSILSQQGKLVVVDFLDCPIPGLRALFRAHRIEFGPLRRTWLRQHLSVQSEEQHRAYLAAWSWYLFSGQPSAAAQAIREN